MAGTDLKLQEVPAVKNNDVNLRFSGLKIEKLGPLDSLEAAWGSLPVNGTGVITLADRVTRFDPSARTGLLLEADVVDGKTTTILRSDGAGWRAWRWTETDGEDHLVVTRTYLSSESTKAPGLVYSQYWKAQPRSFGDKADELPVWSPVGSRFCGFEETI